jgi:preprotein translocase subunit SecY
MKSPIAAVTTFFRLPDLRRKFFIVVGLIVLTRLLSSIPIPGVDTSQLGSFLSSNSAFSLLNIFTGGGLTNFSITMLGVGPFITASIIFQLLTLVIPSLEALQKEGEFGRKKINQYTRLATIPLGLIQGYSTLVFLRSSQIIGDWTPWFLIFMLVIAIGGTLLLMWIGELISEQGLGNGMSIVIAVGIIATFPGTAGNALELYRSGASSQEYLQLGGFILMAATALFLIIFMNEGQRNIPVTYARRTQGTRTYGGVDTHLPIKVNATGVVPIIFAVSMVLFPSVIAKFLEQADSQRIRSIGTAITDFFNNQWYYAAVYFILVIAFTYFYAFIIFQPKQMAENLQKQGGYIPGTRPGEDTERYLYNVIQRLTFVGSIFLALIAVAPILGQKATGVSTLSLGGTSLLITVAVVLEIIRQVRAQIITRTYNAYL